MDAGKSSNVAFWEVSLNVKGEAKLTYGANPSTAEVTTVSYTHLRAHET